jgi:hypothetical protein
MLKMSDRIGSGWLRKAGVLLNLAAVIIFLSGVAAAQNVTFESYTLGNINGQDGWTKTGPYDHAVSASLGTPGFGAQSLRISNAITNGSFADMTFSKPAANEAGEASATNGGISGGVRKNSYQVQFSIATTTPAQQTGLAMSVAPDRGDGARMSYLRFEDQADGIHVFFDDYRDAAPFGGANGDNANGCGVGDDFTDIDIATLNRSVPHTVQFVVTFVNGAHNDIVKIYLDGVLKATGTSWEDYFRFCAEQSADNNTHTVDSLLFRTAGTAAPATSGAGFLVDNFTENSFSAAAGNSTVVVNHSDINNWVFYDDNTDKVDPTLGSFVSGPGTTPLGSGSAQISVGSPDRKNLATYQFTGTPLSAITTLKYSTYNPSAGNGGSANRSGYLGFNVDFNGSDTFQRRLTYVPNVNGAVIQNTWQEWDTINGGSALWLYSGATWPAGVGEPGTTPGTTAKTWSQILTTYPGVRIRVTDSFLGIRVGEPYPGGYTENIDAFKFGTATGTTTFDFDPATTVTVTPNASPNAFDNDYTRINNAIQAAPSGSTIVLSGTFNWNEPNALASWALGSDGQTGTVAFNNDNWCILAPANRNNITVTAASPGAATIQGPGDLPTVDFEAAFQFFSGRTNSGWTISNLNILDIDNAIGFFDAGGPITEYSNTKILNNHIRVPADVNATVAPGVDVTQNIAIHYSFGTNQQISGNTIDFAGNGVSNGANFSTEVGMQSNTSGGSAYDGLQITNNTLNVANAQSANPEVILGIWENGHAHTSNITVSGNSFNNLGGGNNPATNLQRGFRVTSHSSATTTVAYSNNRVVGANVGFQWISGSAFTGNQPVRLVDNTILNGGTGVLVQSQGLANLSFNRIVGNTTGVQNVDGTVSAANNWWGCNYGPGAGGAGCAGTANGNLGTVTASPWLTLTTSAFPTTVGLGEMSAVSSSLKINSIAGDTTLLGNVPNGIPAAFTGSNGTATPTSGSTAGGVTGTTFTATSFGSGGVSTAIDQQTVLAAINVTASCSAVSGATVSVKTGQPAAVALSVDDLTGRGIISTDFTITYNPSVVTFNTISIGSVDGGPGSALTFNSSTPGTLVVSIFRDQPFVGAGTLATVNFTAAGAPGTSSPVSFSQLKFNEGSPCVTTSNGAVNVISGTISGTVSYGNSLLPGPPTRHVPNVNLSAAGSVNVSTATANNGTYGLSGLGSGAYTVTPSKTGGDFTAITANDSAAIAQFVVGTGTLNATQQSVADVSATGGITSFDAALIARYVALLPSFGNTGTWKFTPVSRNYANVNADQPAQDYTALLMGDVTGSWIDPSATRPASGRTKKLIELRLGTVAVSPKSAITVPVAAPDLTNKGIVAYQFDVSYDANVVEPQSVPADVAGTMSEGMLVTANTISPGVLRVVVFGAVPLQSKGVLVNLNFTALGEAGSDSVLSIGNFMFNEGDYRVTVSDGKVQITPQADDEASIEGRLLTSAGSGVANTSVTLTDSNTGESYTTLSNSSGIYRFGGIKAGRSYVISVGSRDFRFAPQAISLLNDLTGVDLIAEQ